MTRRALSCLLLLAVTGCLDGKKPEPLPRTPSLYTRLGGEPGITKVVDDFVANVALSPKIKDAHKEHFVSGKVASLKRKLIDQIGAATGGPQKYTGKNMKDAHAGLGITKADFDALVEALVKALDDNDVKKKER